MLTSRFLVAALPATLLFSLAACSGHEGDSKVEDFASPEGLQSALEFPIVDCQQGAVECAATASDIDARIACNDALAVCLSAAAERSRKIAVRVDACREDARVCLQDGTELATCRDNYEACTDAALNSGSDAGVVASDAGAPVITLDSGAPSLPTFPGAGGGSPGGGGPGGTQPGLPDLGAGVDGGLDNLPSPLRCTIELQLCVATDPSAAGQCGVTARLCLQLP
jgi:hypothetical protein